MLIVHIVENGSFCRDKTHVPIKQLRLFRQGRFKEI